MILNDHNMDISNDDITVDDINRLLTEREGRIGEYWPEVVAVRTEQSSVRTAMTSGQYSPVRPEQARLIQLFIIWHSVSDSKMHFRCNQSF